MATLADLDAAIAAQSTEITTLGAGVTAVDNDVASLLAKLAAGQQVDVTAELTAIKANTSAIATAVANAAAADASVNPPPAAAPAAGSAPAGAAPASGSGTASSS